MLLEEYNREEALELVQEFYVPAVCKEYNIRSPKRVNNFNIENRFRCVNGNLSKRPIVPPLKDLNAETRREIAKRLLDWIEEECYRIRFKDEGSPKERWSNSV